jgi:hypothetical protein
MLVCGGLLLREISKMKLSIGAAGFAQIAILIGVLGVSSAMAQDSSYAGPAKMDVRTFWRQAEILKKGRGSDGTLSNMERAIASIKQKDPTFDVSSMEGEMANAQAIVAGNNSAKTSKKQETADHAKSGHDAITGRLAASKLFDYLFQRNLTSGSPDSAKLAAVLAEYNGKAAELLAIDFGARDRSNTHFRQVFAVLDSRVTGTVNDKGATVSEKAGQDESQMLGEASEERVKLFFYRMQLVQAKWDAARKIFPGEAGYEKMYQAKTAEIAKFGNIEDVQKNIEKNNLAQIQNRRLPAPEVSDPATERLIIDTFNKYLSEEMKGKGYKAILKQQDWGIIRHQVTGIVLGRNRQAAVAYKGGDGKCYVQLGIIVEQQYVGGSFQNSRAINGRVGGGELPCEFAK